MFAWFIIGSTIGLLVGLLLAFIQHTKYQTTKVQLQRTSHDLHHAMANLQKETTENQNLKERVIHLDVTNKNLMVQLQEHSKEVDRMEKKLLLQFTNLSNEILDRKSEKFTKQNKAQIENLLLPLREKIQDFQKQIIHTKEASIAGTTALKEEFQKINALYEKIHEKSTQATQALLGNNKLQGTWGETHALQILERTGLRKNEQYFVQKSFVTQEGKRCIPDIVIKLPDRRHLIMDVKVSLLDYVKFFNATEPNEKKYHLKKHLQAIKAHIKNLGQKKYAQTYHLPSVDFVLLLLPVETAFSAAIQQEPSLFEEAYQHNIVLVSPTTLHATLSIVEHVWKTKYRNEYATQIAKQSGAIYDKFVNFVGYLKKVNQQLILSQKSCDQALKVLYAGRGNLVDKVEKLKQLGAHTSSNKTLPLNTAPLTNGNS